MVTIYAFSIENFKRSRYEVDALMDMAKTKLTQLAQHGELLERYGARIQVLGQKELVRSDVLEAIDRAVDMTKDHKQYAKRLRIVLTSKLTDRCQRCSKCLLSLHFAERDHYSNPRDCPRIFSTSTTVHQTAILRVAYSPKYSHEAAE